MITSMIMMKLKCQEATFTQKVDMSYHFRLQNIDILQVRTLSSNEVVGHSKELHAIRENNCFGLHLLTLQFVRLSSGSK